MKRYAWVHMRWLGFLWVAAPLACGLSLTGNPGQADAGLDASDEGGNRDALPDAGPLIFDVRAYGSLKQTPGTAQVLAVTQDTIRGQPSTGCPTVGDIAVLPDQSIYLSGRAVTDAGVPIGPLFSVGSGRCTELALGSGTRVPAFMASYRRRDGRVTLRGFDGPNYLEVDPVGLSGAVVTPNALPYSQPIVAADLTIVDGVGYLLVRKYRTLREECVSDGTDCIQKFDPETGTPTGKPVALTFPTNGEFAGIAHGAGRLLVFSGTTDAIYAVSPSTLEIDPTPLRASGLAVFQGAGAAP